MDNTLILYEFAMKPDKKVSANFRWAIRDDGQYLRQQNPEGSVRPNGAEPYWYSAPLERLTTLTDEQLEAVRAWVTRCPLKSAKIVPPTPTHRGSLARLSFQQAGAWVVYEVEDDATDTHEALLAELVRIFFTGPGAP